MPNDFAQLRADVESGNELLEMVINLDLPKNINPEVAIYINNLLNRNKLFYATSYSTSDERLENFLNYYFAISQNQQERELCLESFTKMPKKQHRNILLQHIKEDLGDKCRILKTFDEKQLQEIIKNCIDANNSDRDILSAFVARLIKTIDKTNLKPSYLLRWVPGGKKSNGEYQSWNIEKYTERLQDLKNHIKNSNTDLAKELEEIINFGKDVQKTKEQKFTFDITNSK